MKILFVCTLGRMRSKTAAETLKNEHNMTQCAGTAPDADTLLTVDLIEWADLIVCMEQSHRSKVRRIKKGVSEKIITWNIPDTYDYMDFELQSLLRAKYNRHIAPKLAVTI